MMIIIMLILMLMLLFYYIKCLQNMLIKLLNANNEITIFIIILNLYYNKKVIN